MKMDQIKSMERVEQYGEVFTPMNIVNAMLRLVEAETEKVDSRFLEPACGSGNFLVEVLRRKLNLVQEKYAANGWEREQFSMLALMCIYGIDILPDNAAECRENLIFVLQEYPYLRDSEDFIDAAKHVLSKNIAVGDATDIGNKIKVEKPSEANQEVGEHQSIVFPEWGFFRGKFQQRDWTLKELEKKNAVKEERRSDAAQLSLEGYMPGYVAEDFVKPIKDDYEPVTISELAEKYRQPE